MFDVVRAKIDLTYSTDYAVTGQFTSSLKAKIQSNIPGYNFGVNGGIKVDGNVKKVRFMSAGDSEETVQVNIKVARDEGADILITATHEEKWIHADGSSDVKRRFTCNADTDDGQAEEMLGQLKQLVCLDAIVS